MQYRPTYLLAELRINITYSLFHKTALSPEPFLAQICTKSYSGWGFATDPTGGAHGTSQIPLAGKGGRERRRKGRGGEGRGRRGGKGEEVARCLFVNLTLATPLITGIATTDQGLRTYELQGKINIKIKMWK